MASLACSIDPLQLINPATIPRPAARLDGSSRATAKHWLGSSPWKPWDSRVGHLAEEGWGPVAEGTPSEHFSPSSHCHPDYMGSRVGLKRARVAAPECCALHPASGVRGLRNVAEPPDKAIRRPHAQQEESTTSRRFLGPKNP